MEECPKEPNIRTTEDGLADWERIRGIKKNKKIINDTLEQTTNFLLVALNNTGGGGMVMSRPALMLEDFNYKPFNQMVLTDSNEDQADEFHFARDMAEVLDMSKEQLPYKLERVHLDERERMEIVNAQVQNELFELSQLKAEVNSTVIGNMQSLYDLENVVKTSKARAKGTGLSSMSMTSSMFSFREEKTERSRSQAVDPKLSSKQTVI